MRHDHPTESHELKQFFIDKLRSMPIPEWLRDVDVTGADGKSKDRLRLYIADVRVNCEGERDFHNIDEVASCVKFLRMCNEYDFDIEHVQRFIKMYESFKFSGLKGRQQYEMTPCQVFVVCGMFAFRRNFADEPRNATREAIIFIPRKWAKTTLLAAIAMDDFLFGDANAEFHLVANTLDQSKIAYKEAKQLAMQLDPSGKNIRFTASSFNWREGNPTGKTSKVECHTGGGKTKDGAFASKVGVDEYGSATYVKDHCDMADAVNVFESSMGPRKNPLTIITTTAGKVLNGPFEQKLRAAQKALYDQDEDFDWQFLFALHPDEWECTDDYFAQPRVHHKCNCHIGITVQPDYYERQWRKAKGDPEVYKETVTKLFNQFISNGTRPWISADNIRKLQTNYTIKNLQKSAGWRCYIGCDFSKGDDLCCMSYMCYLPPQKKGQRGQFFFDTSAWISEATLHSNPNAVLYEQLIADGWLHVCPGSIIDETMVINELNSASEHVNIMQIGYDPYDSSRFVNLMEAWLMVKASPKRIDPKQFMLPVSQTWGNFNASCQTMYDLINWPEQRVYVSPNPLIPWCFGNAVLEEEPRMQNVKPVKRSANAKIDIVICLLEGLILMFNQKAK